jgi:type IV secretion system protein VirD4
VLQAVQRGESVILTDPKSELYESMAPYLRDQGYVVKVFNLVNMDHSDSWNCLNEVGGSELMAQTFADVVMSNVGGEKADAFWYNAELNLLKALVLYVSMEMQPKDRNFGTVYDLLCSEGERGLSYRMEAISKSHVCPWTGEVMPPSPAYAPYSLFLHSSETVRTSVIIGLGSKLQVLQAQQVRNITSYNDIDLELPGKKRCAYFCIVSDQDSTFDFLSSLFFSFLFIKLIRYADSYCEGGMLNPKVKFILDEFPNCVLIPDFTKKCSVIRSRGCSVAVFFQNVGQMRNRYPNDQWQEILGACDSTVFLGCTDMLTAEYFSNRAGVASVEVESEARELNTMHITNYTPNYRKTNSLGRRQLLTPDEVQRLPLDSELIFIRGMKPLRAKRFDYSNHPEYKKLRSEKAILHEPDWKTSQAQTVSACPTVSAIPDQKPARPDGKSQDQQKKPTDDPQVKPKGGKLIDLDEIF